MTAMKEERAKGDGKIGESFLRIAKEGLTDTMG